MIEAFLFPLIISYACTCNMCMQTHVLMKKRFALKMNRHLSLGTYLQRTPYGITWTVVFAARHGVAAPLNSGRLCSAAQRRPGGRRSEECAR